MIDISLFRDKYRVTELSHAFRLNGVLDVYKNGVTFYDIVNNKYHRIHESSKQVPFCIQLLDTYQEQPDYKPTKKGGVSYKEFKNTSRNGEYDYNTVRAEDYHWKQNISQTSEDHLYFIFHDNNVKIGRTKNPIKRLKVLQTALSHRAKMYVFFNKGFMENKLHSCLSELRKEGEWFSNCVRISHFITKYHENKTGSILITGS